MAPMPTTANGRADFPLSAIAHLFYAYRPLMVSRILPILVLIFAGSLLLSCQSFREPLDVSEKPIPGNAEPIDEGISEDVSSPELPTFDDPGGNLDLRQLTQLALANSPAFASAEGNLNVAKAQRRALRHWRDPELRTGFDWDDVRVQESPGGPGTDTTRRNEAFDVSVRFFPPNPWEMRAELSKALAEISYAEFALRQTGREIINQVRRLYQDLQFAQEDIRLGKGVYRLELEEYERLKAGSLRGPADNQKLRELDRLDTTSATEIRFQALRSELAALVGLEDPSRIRVEGVPNRPVVGFRPDTVEALTEMAFMNNLEIADLDRLQKLAQGDLAAFKATKIPWVSFFEMGRDRRYNEHLPVNDQYSARLAFNVPIFSVFSKEGEVYQEQIRSYKKQAERYRKQIQRRISSRINSIKNAREGLGRFDRETASIIAKYAAVENELNDALGNQAAEVAHRRRLKALERSRERLDAEEAYHEALLDLEEIIRGDIEEVFHKRADAAE